MTNTGGELTGTLAPPMANGEVLFDAPWQGRVFGMARALADAGLYSWDEFRDALIAAIGEWDRSAAASAESAEAEYEYYDHFQIALERLLASKGVVTQNIIDAETERLAARPHGHDH